MADTRRKEDQEDSNRDSAALVAVTADDVEETGEGWKKNLAGLASGSPKACWANLSLSRMGWALERPLHRFRR